jgi:uncharacterized membrane protein
MQQIILIAHVVSGFTALISGLISLLSAKGGNAHRVLGKIYAVAMTGVFITGIWVAITRENRFLFFIAFLSYYSVFAGVRALKLKKLHCDQKPEKIDWIAGGLNTIANLIFFGLGVFYAFKNGFFNPGVILTLGFGIGGLMISYTNMYPFLIRPVKPWHWYLSHIGNMMGGYIATLTAFLSTMVTRFELMNPYLAFAIPSLIGIPLLIFWQSKIDQSFQQNIQTNL